MYALPDNSGNPVNPQFNVHQNAPVYISPQQQRPLLEQCQYKGNETQEGQYYYYYGGKDQKLTDFCLETEQINNDYLNSIERKENQINDNSKLLQPQLIEDQLINEPPKCPKLLYNDKLSTYSLPINDININCELHISTVFVTMNITFINTSNTNINTLLVLPCKGTVTSCNVNINNGQRFYDTTFIDNESAKQFDTNKDTKNKNNQNKPLNKYIPDLFRLPIPNIKPNETITISIDYMQTLYFVENRYHFYIPLNFDNNSLSSNQNINILCSINCLTPGIRYGSTTHNIILKEKANLKCKLIATPKYINNDFHLHYSVQTNIISAALLCDVGSEYEYNSSNQHSFCCFINPPAQINGIFGRDIIFLLDRSGSMTGKPYTDAVKGLNLSLNTLTEYDRFGIIAFDHEQLYFDPSSELSSSNKIFPNNGLLHNLSKKNQAINFLNRTQPGGMTDIKTPLLASINYLNKINDPSRIPFIVLLTDGAVENEKEIVNEINNINNNNVRILTFGIGSFCNIYFLKMMSLITRGWSDGCIYPNELYPKIKLLMDSAKTPILTDIQLDIPNNLHPDIYPKTIPDLFISRPIIISGKYTGDMPKQIVLRGKLQNNQMLEIPINIDTTSIIPISKIFIKQRMDQLTSKYWLTNNNNIKKEIIDISVNETFPSAYTSMVSYELNPKEKESYNNKKHNKKGLSAGQVAGLAGGVVVIGAGVFLLGNVVATMGNVNIIDGLSNIGGIGAIGDIGDFFSNITDCPCDECINIVSCGNLPDCGNIAKIFSCGFCIDCDKCLDIIPCGECNGGCNALPGCNEIGNLCNSCGGIVGGCIDSVGNICECLPNAIGNVCDSCGGIVDGCSDSIGDICQCIPNACGAVCDNLDGLCDIFKDLGGCVSEVGGDVCEFIGKILR